MEKSAAAYPLASRVGALLLGLSTCVVAPAPMPDVKALYDGHRWFELRRALDGTTPALYRGAVACAFNDVNECEKMLRSIIRSSPQADEAAEARGLLLSVSGRPRSGTSPFSSSATISSHSSTWHRGNFVFMSQHYPPQTCPNLLGEATAAIESDITQRRIDQASRVERSNG